MPAIIIFSPTLDYLNKVSSFEYDEMYVVRRQYKENEAIYSKTKYIYHDVCKEEQLNTLVPYVFEKHDHVVVIDSEISAKEYNDIKFTKAKTWLKSTRKVPKQNIFGF